MFPTVIPTAPTARISPAGCASSARPRGTPRQTVRSTRTPTSIRLAVLTTPPVASGGSTLLEPLEQVIPDAERVGHDRERRVYRSARGEEARVHHVEVVHFVRLAVRVQRRGFRVVPEADRPVLVRDARQRDALAEIEAPREQAFVALVAVDATLGLLLHQALELLDQALVALLIVRLVGEDDVAGPVEGDTVIRVREILGGEPEVQRVLGHELERPARRDRRRAGLERVPIELADKGNVAHRELPLLRAEVEIVQRECLLEDRRVGTLGEGHEHRVDMAHVVAPHDVRAVGQALRVLVIGRAQQERRRVDGAGRHDDDVGRIRLGGTLTLDDHPLDVTARGTGLETRDVRAREQLHVGMLEGGVDAEHLGVRLRIDETGMPVAGLAANAAAGSGVPLVQHHAERDVKRLESKTGEIVAELLNPRLMTDRRMRVRSAGRRIRGIFLPAAVHLVELLGLRVIRLQVLVRDRPRGRETVPMLDLPEVLPTEAEERGTVELGVAAHPVVGVRVELSTLSVPPHLPGVVFPLQVDRLRAPVVLLARDVVAALYEQDALAGGGETIGQRSTPRPGPD